MFVGRDARARLQALDRSQAVIAFKLDGTILDANANFLAIMGYEIDEVRGRHHRMFVDPSDRDGAAYQAFWASLAAGTFQTNEYKRIAKGGRTVWLRATYNPILGLTGRPTKIVEFATDVTQERLRNAEHDSQLAAIGKSAGVIEFALDGTILDANANFLGAVGYTIDEIRGRHHRMFVDPEERASPAYAALWQALGRGEYQAGEYRRFGKHGREIWLQATYNPILDPAGTPRKVIKFAIDITQRMLRNADQQGQIEAIGKSQAVIAFALDGTILDANGNFLDVVGYALEEVRGQHHRMFVHPAERESAAYRAFWEALGRGVFQAGEFSRVGKNGQRIWLQATYTPILDPAGRPFKIIKFATDITAEVARRRQFRILSLVANKTDNAVVITDGAGRIEFVNPGFTRLTGYSFAEVEGRKPGEFLQGPATSQETRERIRGHLSRSEPFYDEILNYTKDGRPYYISLSINPVFDDAGRVVRFISIQANVTTTKHASVQRGIQLDAIGASNAICEWTMDGILGEANPHLRSLGVEIARPHSDLAKLIDAGCRQTLLAGQQVKRELSWPARDGAVVWFDAILSVLPDLEGRPEKILMCAVDITIRKRTMEQTSLALSDVLASSEQIDNITRVIDALARQSNLLSLNATIEAARAGDAGRGFAVVALAVRELARRSGASSADIATLVGESQSRIQVLARTLSALETSSELAA